MCCESTARRPEARHTVFFNSAPQANTGRGNSWAHVTGSGAYPRERRTGTTLSRQTLTTESSARTWMGRSWTRKASAMPDSRLSASSSANVMGSSETFPLVSTSGVPNSRVRRWCSGV